MTAEQKNLLLARARGYNYEIPLEHKTYLTGQSSALLPLISGPGTYGRNNVYANSALYACLSMYCNHYVEAQARVYSGPFGDIERSEALPSHNIYRLFRTPNSSRFITWKKILAWAKWMMKSDGNAYLIKVREGEGDITNNITGRVLELWPASPLSVKPFTERDSGDFISYYIYDLGQGKRVTIPVENVVHLIDQIDDRDPRVGVGPVKQILRELLTDEETTVMIGAVMRNAGMPGLIISPAGDSEMGEDAAKEIKEKILATTTGEHRGEPLVMSASTKVDTFGFEPKALDLGTVWNHLEERIAGVLNIPPVLAGLGAGLDRATYANIRVAREMFVEETLIAEWAQDSESLTMQIGPDFALSDNEYIAFDWQNVRALQDDAKAWREWALAAWEKNGITLGEFYKYAALTDTPDDPDVRHSDLSIVGSPLFKQLSFPMQTKALEKLEYDDGLEADDTASDIASHLERAKRNVLRRWKS